MLEVIESDFARLESDTKASEATAQKEYWAALLKILFDLKLGFLSNM